MKRNNISRFGLLFLPLVFASCASISAPISSSLPESSSSSLSSSEFTSTYGGVYAKTGHDIDGFDALPQYVFGALTLNDDYTAKLEDLDAYGLSVQLGHYAETSGGVLVTIGLKTYDFAYDETAGTFTYVGRINRRNVSLTYADVTWERPLTTGERAFSDELFGESLDENFYNYCPTILMEGNAIMHIWYCSNRISGNVTDYIAYRRGELQGDGRWIFSDKELVLEPTLDTWDSRHVCDPSVIKGDFEYQDEHYSYLMAYLGCVTNDSSRNEVGIAISKAPEGPWIKMNHINPIANYYESPEYVNDRWTWGYGQPSLVSVDKAGQVLLFYTKGIATGTFQFVEHWDLSNLDDPIKLASANVSNAGIVNASGGADVINNADFAYDAFNKRLYVIKEDFPYASDEEPTWLTEANTVQYINLGIEEVIGETLFEPVTLRWQKVGSIGPGETGMARVHNTGLVTDEYGWLMNPYQIPIVYTKSDLNSDHPNWGSGGQWPALHTYRLHGYLMEL